MVGFVCLVYCINNQITGFSNINSCWTGRIFLDILHLLSMKSLNQELFADLENANMIFFWLKLSAFICLIYNGVHIKILQIYMCGKRKFLVFFCMFQLLSYRIIKFKNFFYITLYKRILYSRFVCNVKMLNFFIRLNIFVTIQRIRIKFIIGMKHTFISIKYRDLIILIYYMLWNILRQWILVNWILSTFRCKKKYLSCLSKESFNIIQMTDCIF